MAETRDAAELFWVDPDWRGVLPLDGFRLSRSLAKSLRRNRFEIVVDRDFAAVIEGCAEPRDGRGETWINDDIRRLYGALFAAGTVHTVETRLDGRLVGGLYGLAIGGAFFGESMFSRETDASKIALCHLVARLRLGGFRLLDCQFITRHLARFGAVEISRRDYRQRLAAALAVNADFNASGVLTGAEVAELLRPQRLQPTTQTS